MSDETQHVIGRRSYAPFTESGNPANCWQCGRSMPVKATPEMCPNCHHLNFSRAVGMKPTLAEWEAAGRAYLEAVDREDVEAMHYTNETFWELAGRLTGVN